MKKAFLFITALAMSAMMMAEVAVDTIFLKGFAGSEATSYVTELLSGTSQKGIAVSACNFNPSTAQIKGNQTTVAGNFYIYNTDAYPAAITKIEIVAKIDASNYLKNNMYAATGDASQAEVTDVAEGTAWTVETASWTFDEADGVTYFKLYSNEKFTNGSVKDAKVIVTYGGAPAPERVLQSIYIDGEATELEYFVGETFDPAGLKVMGVYDTGEDTEITKGIEWLFDPEVFALGDETVDVLASVEAFTSEVFTVNNIVVTEKPAPVGGNTIVFEDYKEVSFTTSDGAYTVLAERGGGSSDPAYNDNGKDLRNYAKGTFTLTSNNENMTKIIFNLSAQGKKRQAEITPSVGAMAYDVDNSLVTWTGNAAEVIFTVGEKAVYGTDGDSKAGQFDFVSIEITLGTGTGIREAMVNANVRKAMVNGRLIIVKGEKAFDLQGRIVK